MSDTDSPLPWSIESSEVDREYSIFTVRRERVRSPRTGELHGDDPLVAARRELREETGYEGAELALLGTVDLNPSWQTTRIHLVLATGAVAAGAKEEDAGEDTRVRVVPLERARRMVAGGAIRNAVALAGLYLLEARRGG